MQEGQLEFYGINYKPVLYLFPLSVLFYKFLGGFFFGMPGCIYFILCFIFSSHFKGWTVTFWVCVAESIKRLCSLQVVTAHSPLGNKVTPSRCFNRRSHCGQTCSVLPLQPCNSHSQGVLCLPNFPWCATSCCLM